MHFFVHITYRNALKKKYSKKYIFIFQSFLTRILYENHVIFDRMSKRFIPYEALQSCFQVSNIERTLFAGAHSLPTELFSVIRQNVWRNIFVLLGRYFCIKQIPFFYFRDWSTLTWFIKVLFWCRMDMYILYLEDKEEKFSGSNALLSKNL